MWQWLTETRAIPPDVLNEAGVGADPGIWRLPRPDGIPKVSPAAVFPVRDNGDVVFTLSRALRPPKHLPRWVNTATNVAPNPRIALLMPKESGPHRPIIVTEGMLDALSARTAGYPAAALLGTGTLNDVAVDRLARLRRPLLLATDNDTAGQLARDRLTSLLTDRGADVGILTIPPQFKDLNDWHTASRDRWPTVFRAAMHLDLTGHDRRVPPAPGIARAR